MSPELWQPEQIKLSPATKALIGDVEETARQVREDRPLSAEVLARIEDELLSERVYSSNAIEGSTLDLRETVLVLKQGIAALAKKKREATEARNLAEAARRLGEWVRNHEACHDAPRVCEIHGLVLREVDDAHAGRFRSERVMIAGAKHQPPRDDLVPQLIHQAMQILREGKFDNGVLRGAWAHWAIARVHPFFDGNGRMARLWQDLVLLEGELTCGVIRPEDRREYLAALTLADDGQFDELVQLVARRVAKTLDIYHTHIAARPAVDDWAVKLSQEAAARTNVSAISAIELRDKQTLEFERWSRKMRLLQSEFELCAAMVKDRTSGISVRVKSFSPLDFEGWRNVFTGARPGVMFGFAAGGPRGSFDYFFWPTKHIGSGLDSEDERSMTHLALSATESFAGGPDVPLEEAEGPLTLREVFLMGDSFIRVRAAPDGQLVYDRGVSALTIAQDFISEVVLKRLT